MTDRGLLGVVARQPDRLLAAVERVRVRFPVRVRLAQLGQPLLDVAQVIGVAAEDAPVAEAVGGNPEAVAGAARDALSKIDPRAPVETTTLSAVVDNVFDRHYQPTIGYNGRPRTVFVGVSWSPRR